jgi:hypothetical protein
MPRVPHARLVPADSTTFRGRRRWVVARLAIAWLGLAVVADARADSGAASHPPATTDARADIETWVRLRGDSAGAVSFEWVTGTAYAVPADADSVALFAIESVTMREFRRIGPAHYIEQSHACRLYRDATNGSYIDRFVNPLTLREVPLPVRCSQGPAVRYTPERVTLASDVQFDSTALNAPLRLERIDAGAQIVFRRDAHSRYRARLTGELRRETSLDTFTVDAAALADPARTSLPASYQWTSVTQWMAELGMGATPGRMLWSVVGRKYARAADLPDGFRQRLEQQVPGALAPHFDWTKF